MYSFKFVSLKKKKKIRSFTPAAKAIPYCFIIQPMSTISNSIKFESFLLGRRCHLLMDSHYVFRGNKMAKIFKKSIFVLWT